MPPCNPSPSAPPWPRPGQSRIPGPPWTAQHPPREAGPAAALITHDGNTGSPHPHLLREERREGKWEGRQPCSGPLATPPVLPRQHLTLLTRSHARRGGCRLLGGWHHLANWSSGGRPWWTRPSPGQSLEEARSGQTRGAWVGRGRKVRSPTNASDFYSFFPCLVFLFFFPFHRHQFCVCGCRCHLVFKKKSHLVLVFCRHRHQGRNEADTNMRQAGRAPEGSWAPNTESVPW